MVRVSSTPLYDGMLAGLLARAADGDRASSAMSATASLHVPDETGRCRGCGLDAPCPTTGVLQGQLEPATAAAEVRRRLVARAVSEAAAAPAATVQHQEQDQEQEQDEQTRPAPVLPPAAELFARNPGTARAIDALLGMPARH
jgi:hypothetical protein